MAVFVHAYHGTAYRVFLEGSRQAINITDSVRVAQPGAWNLRFAQTLAAAGIFLLSLPELCFHEPSGEVQAFRST